ncbi:MAG: PAS domain S-box protein, partial [Ignavibacteriae bacterium]|nr:PAS domain S-box protein [Ignavibacteriota bacterium]
LKDNKIGIGAIIRDITDRKKAEERLKEQHSLLITIIDNSPDLIYIKDTQSRFLAASKSVANYMGTTPEELINKTDFDFYKKELAEQYYNDERKIIETGQAIINKEEPRKNPDSSVTWILTTKVPLNNVEGKITGIVGISRDITERKHAEEKLILSTENWNKTFNAIQDGIALLDANQQIIQCNQSFLDFIQKTKNEIIGNNCFYYVHGTKCPIEGCPFKRMQISKKREKMEMHINGFVCEILVDPILDKNNNILGAVHIISDISNRKRIEKALQEAKEKAEEANRTKSNFLASMSHELRTPMTGILGFAEILCDSLKDEEDKHKAEIVLKGGQRLMHTLNLILDLSRIEADRIDVKMRLTNLSSVVIESAKLFEILAKDKKLELKTEIDENIFAILDEQLTEQVFSNLIKNALIYTDKGSVCVEVKREMINEKEYAVVKIIDTGIGIPENLREVIFEPFRQVSEGHSREFEGTGLGLTLAKKYIEMMNGSISVSSEVGVGSTFKVKFPTAVDTGKEKIKTNKIEKKHENIIELSGNKGIITTQEIRKIPGYEKIPIIAVTAFAMDGDKEKFIACGCSHYIAKPFSFAELRKLIKGLVENKK